MADYNSHAAAPTNVFMGPFFNALSADFTANHKTRSTAPKTPSKNLAVGLVKILRKRRKEPSKTASKHRGAHRLNREESNLGSMERVGPYPGPVPTGIRQRTESNRISAWSSARGIGFWAWSGLEEDPVPYPVLLILVIVSVLVGISWRFSKGSGAKCLVGSHTGWALRAIPLVLMLILHCLSSSEISKIKSQMLGHDADHRGSSERFSFKEVSLTPWALAALVVFLVFMAQYQSEFRIRWFF